MNSQQHSTIAGVDVAKAKLDFATSGNAQVRQVAYDSQGIDELIKVCKQRHVTLVVLEATGGLERPLVRALAAAGVAFHIANPRQVRDLARAMGTLAKTDTIDARVLVAYGEKFDLRAQVLPEENSRKLTALSFRHQQLADLRVVESNRLGTCEAQEVRTMHQQTIDLFDQQIQRVAQLMDELIQADQTL